MKVTQESLQNQSLKDFEWLVEIGLPPKHDLNTAFNRMLRRAQGELVVFLQDAIKAPPDGLQKFWDAYQANPTTFMTAPVGKTLDWKEITWDWRNHPEGRMDWMRWEIDWAAAPLKALKDIGGFDEELDKFWSSDNVNVGKRAQLKGYNFGNLIENPAVAYDHDAVMPHPFRARFNPDFTNERLALFEGGYEIDYLC